MAKLRFESACAALEADTSPPGHGPINTENTTKDMKNENMLNTTVHAVYTGTYEETQQWMVVD